MNRRNLASATVNAGLARDAVDLSLDTVQVCFLAGPYLRAEKAKRLRSRRSRRRRSSVSARS